MNAETEGMVFLKNSLWDKESGCLASNWISFETILLHLLRSLQSVPYNSTKASKERPMQWVHTLMSHPHFIISNLYPRTLRSQLVIIYGLLLLMLLLILPFHGAENCLLYTKMAQQRHSFYNAFCGVLLFSRISHTNDWLIYLTESKRNKKLIII